ncbi:PepSY domain-containing protein [Tenacibaculum dicentrarchi]|nr:PepSY domain-containing protein [Tenacibaculum dicentrarchi]MCD8419592.1 PepSY domain-containing protein [Tenacibaculum dicentrarchi]MCD8436075.1 PepSY domain-containing protein [Tenacibaculum dicentrarchi]MCD8451401.1 PepSY domain-containing protein [Tenacibaculum dicentrarchi]MCG8827508.1 PepSY domain-containing protein [Tenacibaculum dicentrarchi]
MKNRKLNQWLWKWHFIAGLVSLPFILVLSITGAIYLFNPDVESKEVAKIQDVENLHKTPISYQQQWENAKEKLKKKPSSMVINDNPEKATEFVFGRFSHKTTVFVNQYTGEATGTFSPKDTWMYTVRKLHGELLGGKIGTKIIELIASWMVVLILTGIYIWWPFSSGIKGVFTIRFKEGKRILFRDLHAVTGFWMSLLLLLILAGGLPWTDVFGSNFKWVQKVTNTGFPKTWSGRGLISEVKEKRMTIEEMVAIANQQKLKGTVSIGLPKSAKSTFSVANKTFPLTAQRKLHFDQYSGKLVKEHTWSDVGFLMRGRMWVMAFHQGQFGGWNWWLMFLVSLGLTLMTIAGLLSYLYRKQKGNWGVPKVSSQFKVGKFIVFILVLLGILLPMFGISILLILLFEQLSKK